MYNLMVNGILFDFIVKIHSFNSRKREDRYCFGKNSFIKNRIFTDFWFVGSKK